MRRPTSVSVVSQARPIRTRPSAPWPSFSTADDQAALEAHRATPHFAEHVLNGLIPIAESRTPELYSPLGD